MSDEAIEGGAAAPPDVSSENDAAEAAIDAAADAAATEALMGSFTEPGKTTATPKEPPSPATETPPAVEPVVEPPSPFASKAAPDGDDEIVRKFNILSDQQNRLRKEEAELNKRAAEFDRLTAMEARLKTDPWAELEAHGWDGPTLVDKATGDQTPAMTELRRVKTEMAAMKAQLEQRDAAIAAREAQAETSNAITEFKSKIPQFVAGDATKFNHLNALYTPQQQSELVFSVMETAYNTSKTALTIEQAATAIETELAQLHSRLSGATSQAAPVTPTPPVSSKSNGTKSEPSKTLSNDLTATTPARQGTDELTDEELDEMALQTLMNGASR